jgi:hypothetical protein
MHWLMWHTSHKLLADPTCIILQGNYCPTLPGLQPCIRGGCHACMCLKLGQGLHVLHAKPPRTDQRHVVTYSIFACQPDDRRPADIHAMRPTVAWEVTSQFGQPSTAVTQSGTATIATAAANNTPTSQCNPWLNKAHNTNNKVAAQESSTGYQVQPHQHTTVRIPQLHWQSAVSTLHPCCSQPLAQAAAADNQSGTLFAATHAAP